jgi:hypothetical protein
MEEAAALCSTLGEYIKREAQRRQSLLRADLARLKVAEKTVFHEIAELPQDLMAGPKLAIAMVSKFCPKSPRDQPPAPIEQVTA